MSDDFDADRVRAHLVLLALVWLQVIVDLSFCILSAQPWVGPTAVALAAAALGTAAWRMASPATARMSLAAAYIVTISVLLLIMGALAWQLNLYMTYFVALALLALYCDGRVIAVATATAIVCPLGFNLLLAAQPETNLGRAFLFGLMLVIEAGVLMWLVRLVTAKLAHMNHRLHETMAAQADSELRAAEEIRHARAAEAHSQAAQVALQQKAADEQAGVIETLADALAKLASGDLTYRIDQCFTGRYEKLREDFHQAIIALQQTMLVIADDTKGIGASSQDIAQAADDLSRQTEQQAAQVEATASSLDEIAVGLRQTTDAANQAQEAVALAKIDAEKGSEVVQAAMNAMDGIERSTQRVNTIIGVIDEIAFQTNLLALNAGVEAARAGESGRGFAVVASEVRGLAQRSADAAKQIKQLIAASSLQVRDGVSLVVETGGALQRMLAQVSEINLRVMSMAASAKEQSVRLDAVNNAVGQIDQMTRKNASMAEASRAANRALAEETDTLLDLVNCFQIGGDTAADRAQDPVARAMPHRRVA